MCMDLKGDRLNTQKINKFKCLVEEYSSDLKSMSVKKPKEFDEINEIFCRCFLYFVEKKSKKKFTDEKETLKLLNIFGNEAEKKSKSLSNERKEECLKKLEIVAVESKKYVQNMLLDNSYLKNSNSTVVISKIYLFLEKLIQLKLIRKKEVYDINFLELLLKRFESELKAELDAEKYNQNYVKSNDNYFFKESTELKNFQTVFFFDKFVFHIKEFVDNYTFLKHRNIPIFEFTSDNSELGIKQHVIFEILRNNERVISNFKACLNEYKVDEIYFIAFMILEAEYLVFKRFEKTLQDIDTTDVKINIKSTNDFIKYINISRSFIWDIPFTTLHNLTIKKKTDLRISDYFNEDIMVYLRLLTYHDMKECYETIKRETIL